VSHQAFGSSFRVWGPNPSRSEVSRGLKVDGLPHSFTPDMFRGGLVFKAHRLVYHSTLGLIVIKKKKTPGMAASSEPHLLRVEFTIASSIYHSAT